MIDPHVLHGGASSWLRIAAPENDDLAGSADLGAAGDSGFASVRLKPDPTEPDPDPTEPEPTEPEPTEPDPTMPDPTEPDPAADAVGVSPGSFMFTPARNWASWLRNLVAIQRKM